MTATAQAQLQIKKHLTNLLAEEVDTHRDEEEPVAKRVKRRTDRIKLEPDDDFLDPDYILPHPSSSGRGVTGPRGRGRPRKQPRFIEEEEENETHGEVEWYKPDLRVEEEEDRVTSQPRPPRGRKPGTAAVKRPFCPGPTEAENEQDLANKGLDFLQVGVGSTGIFFV